MPYPTKLLAKNEKVVIDLHPHWWYLTPPGAALVAAVALGIFVLTKTGGDDPAWPTALRWVAGALILVALGWFLVRLLKWRSVNFVVTTDRCIFRSGLISHSGVEIPLERINTVFYHQNLFERIIGAGDLEIESGGERGRERFTDVWNPARVQHALYQQIEANKHRDFDRIGQEAAEGMKATQAAAPPPPARELTIPEQIEKLAELRDRGVLSEEEFMVKKAGLLDRM